MTCLQGPGPAGCAQAGAHHDEVDNQRCLGIGWWIPLHATVVARMRRCVVHACRAIAMRHAGCHIAHACRVRAADVR